MARWVIYKKDGSIRIGVQGDVSRFAAQPSLEYSGEWMGETFVTLSFSYPEPIGFEIGDYVEYRGEKFVINYDPTVIKSSSRGSHGNAFSYENVKFNSLSYELTDVRFLDYVLEDNNLHYTSLPTFSFYAANIDDFADRLQANTNRYCEANGFAPADYWQIMTYDKDRSVARGCDGDDWDEAYIEEPARDDEKTDANISIDNQSVWDAMSHIKDAFGLSFIVRGRKVIIGAGGIPTSQVFRYGKGKGLYQIERTADSEQQVITKLYAYGSEKNMPNRYYADLNADVFGIVTEVRSDLHKACLDLLFNKDMFTGTPENDFYPVAVKYDNVSYDTAAHLYYRNDIAYVGIALPLEGGLLNVQIGDRIYFSSGVYEASFPSSHKDYSTSNLPNNMSVNVLMLPGFPNQSLKDWVLDNGGIEHEDGSATWHNHTAFFSEDKYQPYILSKNYETLGIRESTKRFDNAEDGGDIYPTISGTGYDEVVTADTINDNGVFRDGATVPDFKVVLKNLGFNLRSLLQSDTTLSMKDGYCGGRDFHIKSAVQEQNGTWTCTCERNYDSDLDIYFPYSYAASVPGSVQSDAYQIHSEDRFVLTCIAMPDTYIELASERLLDAALVFLEANEYTRYTFQPSVDEIYVARQHDSATANGGRSIYMTLKEGDLMLFEDSDLDVDGSVFIDTLRIKEYSNGRLPSYEVTLRNDKQVGTIERIQEQINSLSSGGGVSGSGGGGVNVPQTRKLIEAYGADYFISKRTDDTASGVITFEQGIRLVGDYIGKLIKDGDALSTVPSDEALLSEAKSISTFLNKHGDTATGLITFLQGLVSNDVKSSNYSQGDIDGEGFRMWNENGASHLDIDRLSVRKKAVFTELEIKKLRYSGGNLIFSAAGGEIVRVVSMSSVWRCYFKADDGDTEVANMWSIGDLAMCKTFNLGEGGSAEQRYYWRKVTNVGTSSLSGEKYAWINLSKTDYDPAGTDEPQVGDSLVQIGHVSDTERQNVIMLEVVGDNAPALKGYDGISNYNALVKANLVFQWSPKECWVRSNKFRLLSTSNGSVSESPIVNDRGAWVSGVNYAYYDRVSYNGNLWLCTNQNGTSGVPGTSADWLLQVSKGDDGKAFNIKDKVNSVSDLPVTGEDGDAYMVGDHLYVWSTIYTPYWNGYGQQDSPFSGFVSNSALSLTAGTKYKVVIDAIRVQSEFVDVVPTRFSLSNTLYLAVGAEMTSGGAQATESEAFLLYPDGNNVDAYYQKTGLGNYSSITIDVYTSTKGWRDMGTLRGVDGSDAYNIQLSTDNVIYDTDVNGDAILPNNPSSTPIATVALYKGSDVVSNPTVSVTSAVGCTASASGTNIYITAVSASQGQVTLSVSKGTEFSGSKVLRFACITYETMKSFAQEIVGDSMTNYATSARVATLEGDIYTPDSGLKDKVNEGVFGQSSTSVTSRLSTSEGAISDLQQTAEGIEASVKGGLVNLFSDGERERASVQGTVSVSVTDIIRSTIGYAYATYGADVKMSGESATAGNVSLSLYSGSSIYSKSFDIPRDGAWHRVSITVAIPTTTPLSERTFELVFTENGSAGYSVRHIMVQLGVYASQWSPSVADNETKFLQKPDSIGLVAYKQGGEVASIGAFSDGKVKLTGEEIILEGNVTANGNVHINQDGTLYAKNGVFEGYLRSSVELSSDTSYAIRETLNFMATNDCNVYLPCDPDYIGSRVLIIGGFKGNGSAAIVRVYPGMAYGKRCYQIFPYGDYAGQDPMTWLSDDAYTKGVKMPWANIGQNYDPWQCRVIIGVNDMPSDGSGIKFSNGAIELLGVPCYKGSSGEHYPIYKLKEDANGTIVGKKLNPNGTIDTLVDTTYSRDGEVENWTQWVLINKSVDNIVITE